MPTRSPSTVSAAFATKHASSCAIVRLGVLLGSASLSRPQHQLSTNLVGRVYDGSISAGSSDQRLAPAMGSGAAVEPSALAFSYHWCASAASGLIPFTPIFSSTNGS